MTAITVALTAAAFIAGAIAIVFAFRIGRTDAGRLGAMERGQAELGGQMKAMADAAAAAQAALGGSLNDRLDAISKAVTERLDVVSQGVGENLSSSAEKTAETLGDLRQRLDIIDAAQKNIVEVSGELSGQVGGLQNILSNKQARGAFGEIQLNDLVADVLPPSAYEMQATLSNGKRPDCLIKLPNPPGPIAIDSKFPLESYHVLRAAGDEAARTQAERQFRAHVLKHVHDIAERYLIPGETTDYALMFLPSEAVYSEIHANFPDVVDKAHRKKVAIVSPTTMWAALNTIRAIFKDVRTREQAAVIQAEVHVLLQDVARLDDRTGKLLRHLEMAGDDLRQMRISTEKITQRGERIEALELEDAPADEAEALTTTDAQLPLAPPGHGRSGGQNVGENEPVALHDVAKGGLDGR